MSLLSFKWWRFAKVAARTARKGATVSNSKTSSICSRFRLEASAPAHALPLREDPQQQSCLRAPFRALPPSSRAPLSSLPPWPVLRVCASRLASLGKLCTLLSQRSPRPSSRPAPLSPAASEPPPPPTPGAPFCARHCAHRRPSSDAPCCAWTFT